MEIKKTNWFVRTLLIAFLIGLSTIVAAHFTQFNPAYTIDQWLFCVLLLMTVLILSESFNNLSIGKVLILNRTLEQAKTEITTIKNENESLRNHLLNVVTKVSQSQINATLHGSLSDTQFRDLFKITKASAEESADKTKIESQEEEQQKVKNEENGKKIKEDYWKLRRAAYGPAIKKYLEKHNLQGDQLILDVKMSSNVVETDPIMTRSRLFDGYITIEGVEYFFEVMTASASNIILADRLYVSLARILRYRELKKSKTQLVLLQTSFPKRFIYGNDTYFGDRWANLLQLFQPAIANGLLVTSTVLFSEEECQDLIDHAANSDPKS